MGTADEHRTPVKHSKVASLGAKVVCAPGRAYSLKLRDGEAYEVVGLRPATSSHTSMVQLHGHRAKWFHESHFVLAPCPREPLKFQPAPDPVVMAMCGMHDDDIKAELDAATLRDTNPKTRFGQAKPPLGLIPGAALVHVAEALRDGSDKYGPANWREDPVSASTYFSAALRHAFQYWDGEDMDPQSKVHHLAHAATNMMILLDAMAAGTLIDDRPASAPTADLIRQFTRVA